MRICNDSQQHFPMDARGSSSDQELRWEPPPAGSEYCVVKMDVWFVLLQRPRTVKSCMRFIWN